MAMRRADGVRRKTAYLKSLREGCSERSEEGFEHDKGIVKVWECGNLVPFEIPGVR